MDYLCVMIQKSLRILMLMLYLISVSGISVRSHFCGEKLDSIHLLSHNLEEDPCECVDLGSTDCCSDVVVKAPLTDAQLHVKILSTTKPFALSLQLVSANWIHPKFPSGHSIRMQGRDLKRLTESPPQLSELGVFRI